MLGRCASCGRHWVQGSYEPYSAFDYWVLWPLGPEDFPVIADLADGLVVGAWHTAEIRQHASSLPAPDQAALQWHYERSYGRDPVHEYDPLPKPDIEWMATAIQQGDDRATQAVDRIVEASRRRRATVRPLPERR